jgi:hypothetical protein
MGNIFTENNKDKTEEYKDEDIEVKLNDSK